MTDRPILFSGPMVRAILAGQKTQTRRVVDVARVQKKGTLNSAGWRPFDLDVAADRRAVETNCGRVCPYGEVGDRLWVRETWGIFDREALGGSKGYGVAWRADGEDCAVTWIDGPREHGDGTERWKARETWTPSIHMPRWASRVALRIESIRVERLNTISEDDAKAEGVETLGKVTDARGAFVALWDSINGKRAPWLSNPWVWVVAFAREWAEPEERR